MKNEIKTNIVEEGLFKETNCPFTIELKFSTLSSFIEISRQEPLISCTPDDSVPDLLGFISSTIFDEYNLSPLPVDVLSIEKFFLNCDMAQGMMFRGKGSRLNHSITMDVDPGYTYI